MSCSAAVRRAGITDGPLALHLMVQAVSRCPPSSRGRSALASAAPPRIGVDRPQPWVSDLDVTAAFRSEHGTGAQFTWGDGSVSWIEEGIDFTLYRRLAIVDTAIVKDYSR